jgi:lipoprotein-anchoring transpeptidase ErfK/SrfK
MASGTRIRYKRLTAVGGACAVTLVAVLGGVGLLPLEPSTRPVAHEAATLAGATTTAAPQAGKNGKNGRDGRRAERRDGARFRATDTTRDALAAASLEVPVDSGEGRRVVFDMSAQRVWLVGGSGAVRRTYPVSGSVEDNLEPGTYEVYSRSTRAWGINDSGTMKYMVRFAHGDTAAIGFHDIPVKDGEHVQSTADLGTPQSHGCIRQWRPDAKALWDFAPLGTTVVVVA